MINSSVTSSGGGTTTGGGGGSSLNFGSIKIYTTKICANDSSKVIFKTFDTKDNFTLIDSAKLTIAGKPYSTEMVYQSSRERYFFDEVLLEEGNYTLSIEAEQKKHYEYDTITLEVVECSFFEKNFQDIAEDFINGIKDNKKGWYIVGVILILLILLSIGVAKKKRKV